MKLENWIITFVVFSVFILGGMMLITDINTNYNKNMSTSEYSGVYNTSEDIYNIGQGMKNDTFGGDVEEDESFESMIKGSYSALRLVGGTFGMFKDIIDNIASEIGVPEFFVYAAIIVMIVLVVFALIYIIRGFKQ